MFFYYVGGSAIGAVGGIFLKNYGWTGIVLMVILLLIGALAICFQLTFSQLLIYEQSDMRNLKKAVQN
jgi:YNFM family putative membrane transporter